MTRVLVTGAAGFVGSHVVEALARRGDEVIGVDNFDPYYGRAAKEQNLEEIGARVGFTFVESDVLEVERLANLLTPDTAIVHLAARAGVRSSFADPLRYMRANVLGTVAVAEAARSVGASRIVFSSSSSIYGDATPAPFREDAPAVHQVSPYAASKRGAELFLAGVAPAYGLRVAALRLFTVYGPRQRPDLAIHAFARRLFEGEPVVLFGDGSEARDYTYADDIVAGVLAALAWTDGAPTGVEHFNLGGNRAIPTSAMLAEVAAALGVEPRVDRVPLPPGDVRRTAADLTKSAAILGYAPRTSFREGVRRFVAWFLERHGRPD